MRRLVALSAAGCGAGWSPVVLSGGGGERAEPVGVVEQGAGGEAGGGQGGEGGGGEQHVHDDDLVADGGQRADAGQDQPGHGAGQADQADGLGGVDRGDQGGAQRGVQVRGERLGGGLAQAQPGLDRGAG